MPTKVLVFESDAAFAGELRSELGKLGCVSQVVDDGNLGLQAAASERPDLILLSIELPRMNGFSVCNKLKKDPALKDVPLIIMSSESSEETFEQHRKLRTRAEDYVHKPIAFGELLQHIQNFVHIDRQALPAGNDVVVIDDDIAGAVQMEDEDEGTEIGMRPDILPLAPSSPPKGSSPPKSKRMEQVDAEMDAFADAAFGRITGESAAPPAGRGESAAPPAVDEDATLIKKVGVPGPAPVPAVGAVSANPGVTKNGTHARPEAARTKSSPDNTAVTATGVDVQAAAMEMDRLRADLEKMKTRAEGAERSLDEARAEAARQGATASRADAAMAEVERLQRELDDLRARPVSIPAKAAGVSSKEFLDLREALNKKDKEILSLKETLGRKEKDILEGSERSLALERTKSELNDKLLEHERELNETREKVEVLTADKEQAKKAGEDFKARLTRTQAELETKVKELGDAKAAHVQDADQKKRAFDTAVSEAETRRQRDLETAAMEAARDKAAALDAATQKAARDLTDAVTKREGELKTEHEAKLAALHRAHKDEMGKLRTEVQAERDAKVGAAEKERDAKVAAAEQERDERVAAAHAEREAKVAAAEKEREERVAAAEADRDARVAAAEQDKEAGIAAAKQERDDGIAVAEKARRDEVTAAERERDERVAAAERARDERVAEAEREKNEGIMAAENDRDARLAALEARRVREGNEAREAAEAQQVAAEAQQAAAEERIAGLTADVARLEKELTDLQETKRTGDAAFEARIAGLEGQIRDLTTERDGLLTDLATARERIAGLESDGDGLRRELHETQVRLARETKRAETAYAKWNADKTSLERAKDALAVALAQIEETDTRPLGSD